METFTVRSQRDGLELAAARRDAENARAVVQISHGMAERKERYFPFMEYLASKGIASVINDHRGHGGSVRERRDLGYFGPDGAEMLVDDLHQVTRLTRDRYPDKKLFLLGHSMGSLASRVFAQRFGQDIDGLILMGNPGYSPSAPWGIKKARQAQERRGKYARSKLLTVCALAPFILKAPSLRSLNAWICTDKAVVREYDRDPLCGFEFYANGYEAMLTLLEQANACGITAPHTELPVIFMSGEKDACMGGRKKLEDAARLMREAGFRDVGVRVLPGLRHEILNEKGHEKIYSDIADWILDRC